MNARAQCCTWRRRREGGAHDPVHASLRGGLGRARKTTGRTLRTRRSSVVGLTALSAVSALSFVPLLFRQGRLGVSGGPKRELAGRDLRSFGRYAPSGWPEVPGQFMFPCSLQEAVTG